MIIVPKNHISFTSSEYLKKICASLKEHFSLSFFDYSRNYYDGRHIYLSTHPEATDLLFSKDFHKTSLCFKHPAKYEFDSILWDGCDANYSGYAFGQIIIKLFDIAHGFTIVERSEKYTETFGFAGSFSNSDLNNLYYNNLSALKYFLLYFRENAEILLDNAGKETFHSPYSTSLIDVPDDILIKTKKEQLNSFFANTKIKRIYLSGKFSEIFLTNKEMQCIPLLLEGCSYKQIARLLNISSRTVESRLGQLRGKLGCEKKHDLIDTLNHTDIKRSLNSLLLK